MRWQQMWQTFVRRLARRPRPAPFPGRRRSRPLLEALEERWVPSNWFVSTLGADANPGTIAAPFASIQHAVNVAQSGDRIHVALGTYGYVGADRIADDARFGSPGPPGTLSADFLHVHPAVVLIYNKALQIYGGFDNGFTAWAPSTFRTYIDGGGVNRGVYVLGQFSTAPAFATPAGLDMEGFTIQACKAAGELGLSGGDAINASGAGMWINCVSTTADFQGPFLLKNMVFRGNLAVGNNTLKGSGGSAVGGALELDYVQGLSLDHVTFDTNRIQSGTGGPASGDARGAALDVNASSNISGHDVTFYNNMAVAASNGTALGGAMEVQFACSAALRNVIALNNSVTTDQGTGAGGAFAAEDAILSLTNAAVRGNVVAGSGSAGQQGGGGIGSINSQLTLDQVQVINNTVTSTGAPASGGGLYVGYSSKVLVSGNPGDVNMTNTVVADNTVQITNQTSPPTVVLGGGGMLLQGMTGTITQSTFANNHLSGNLLDGQAILLTNGGPFGATATIADSIIANHTNTNGAAALSVLSQSLQNAVTLNQVLYADNTKDDNSDGLPNAAGTYSGLGTVIRAASADFTSPGGPNFDYSLSANSPAVNRATGSKVTVDIEGNPRTGTPDLGAYEAPAAPRARSSVALFDPETGIWQLRQSNAGGFFPDGPLFAYGSGGGNSKPVVGDWNGDGTATVGVVEVKAFDFNGKPFLTDSNGNAIPVSVFELRETNSPGTPDIIVPYGSFNAMPVAGNWVNNASHIDHIGVVEIQNGAAVWKLRNSFTRGAPDITIAYGGVTSTPVVGDWNGDGVTTLGVVESGGGVLTWKLRNSFSPGPPDAGSFPYGGAAAVPITGDWNNDKTFTPGVDTFSRGLWQLRNENSGGPADAGAFTFGPSGGSDPYAEQWIPLAGDFDGLG
jgi:hypothetical protein